LSAAAAGPRIGFLGAGLIAGFHAYMLGRSGEAFAMAGVYDAEPDRAERFGADWGATLCETEAQVLASCDAVYVCTWTSEHRHLVEAAVAAGRPVFCEKPLATSLQEARAMTEVVERSGVVNQVGLILRYSPAFILIGELLRQPEAGRVMSVLLRDDQYIPVQGMYASTWRGDRSKAGSGTLLEHSIHDLDILEHTIGPITSVSARSQNFHGLPGIEDSVAAVLTFADGGLGALTSVWHDILERPSQRHMEVFCERLRVELRGDFFGPVVWAAAGGQEQELGGDDLIAEVARRGLDRGNPDGAFVRAVRGGCPAYPSFSDALRAHVLCDAAYRSVAGGGEPIPTPPAGA